VNDNKKRRITFALRLAVSLKDTAKLLADRDGISLNHFINMAVAEKLARFQKGSSSAAPDDERDHGSTE
jgi:predicted HicB family RNase H-like nuclease